MDDDLPDDLLLKIQLPSLPDYKEIVTTMLIRWKSLWKSLVLPDLNMMEVEKPSIHDLPDDLLLKILLSIPDYKEIVTTMLISKRWKSLWKLVPDLKFNDESFKSFQTFKTFVDKSLLINNSQVLETLHLILSRKDSEFYLYSWLQAAVKRSVREVKINLNGQTLMMLPSCLNNCKTLKTLTLQKLDIGSEPCGFRLPSLKTLHLVKVSYSPTIFLRLCPVLEELSVSQSRLFDTDEPSLSTCINLKKLVLENLRIKTVPHWFCLPSVKTLHLLSVKFSKEECVAKFLSNCPVLEDLVVKQTADKKLKILFNIHVPTLKRLYIDNSSGKQPDTEEIHGFVIKAPSLEKLNFKDTYSNFLVFEYMPNVIKANIETICDQSENFIGSFTSVQQLSLCSLTSETPYPSGTFFFYLEHLELCTCSAGWVSVLACILNDAPRLRSLKLKLQHDRPSTIKNNSACYDDLANRCNESTCLSTSLEMFEWRHYEDTEQDKNVAEYILANATHLKKAGFSTRCRDEYRRMWMLKDIEEMHRVSKACQLSFEETLM